MFDLKKTYTVKSNAARAMRKALAAGDLAGDYRVVTLMGGFRIVPAEPDVIDVAMARGVSPGKFAELAQGKCAGEVLVELVAKPGIEEVEDVADSVVAENAAEMTEAPAASRDARVPPGLARLRADENAEAIREAVIVDQASSLAQMREALISDPRVTIGAAAMADYRAEHPVRRGREAKLDAPKVATAPKPAASPDALRVLVALFHSPALHELADDARVGEWVDYKTINESDRPHGFAGRQVSGLIAGLQRRGLVECRMDKPGKYSTRLTAAGFELAREAGR
jgi:hypothetical protein